MTVHARFSRAERRLFEVLPSEIEFGNLVGDRHGRGHPHPLPRPPAEPIDHLVAGGASLVERLASNWAVGDLVAERLPVSG